jgi:hypothetical protein
MTLLQKTKEIVSNSIRTAIFIDEKALENYKQKSSTFIREEELSINLNKNFKNKGISLSVHKFKQADLTNTTTLDYLFKRRDLVLLDWKLDGNDGEEYSLNLLSKVVKEKHIHFCSIYTSESNYDEIINNICTYFSGYTDAYYEAIIGSLNIYKELNETLFEQISFDNSKTNNILFNNFRDLDKTLPNLIKQITNLKDFGKALIQVKYAFSNFHKSNVINPVPTHINRTNYSLNINNTIITIIPKTENSAHKILNKLYQQIYKSENCFTQLLGLDMQNSFSENSSFVNSNLLDTNLDTLMYHRRQLINNNLENEFEIFIKNILLEHSKMKLESSLLNTLDKTFLDRITKRRLNIESQKIAKLNTFYNGSYINNKAMLNFGDVFRDNKGYFYLCITPLCDCILHGGKSNIGFKYYFVKGQKSNLDEAIKVGEKGFVSFLDDKTSVVWKQDEYIKPFQLYIPIPNLVDNKITYLDWDKNNDKDEVEIEYIFTIRQNYTQRIVNHAFGHPIRVGVDFVKK